MRASAAPPLWSSPALVLQLKKGRAGRVWSTDSAGSVCSLFWTILLAVTDIGRSLQKANCWANTIASSMAPVVCRILGNTVNSLLILNVNIIQIPPLNRCSTAALYLQCWRLCVATCLVLGQQLELSMALLALQCRTWQWRRTHPPHTPLCRFPSQEQEELLGTLWWPLRWAWTT